MKQVWEVSRAGVEFGMLRQERIDDSLYWFFSDCRLAFAVLFSIVALLASYVPARRAMRVDPLVALRYE